MGDRIPQAEGCDNLKKGGGAERDAFDASLSRRWLESAAYIIERICVIAAIKADLALISGYYSWPGSGNVPRVREGLDRKYTVISFRI
jgi:hypothetical protein